MADQIQIVGQPSAQDINRANEVLFEFETLFPFDFFPDKIILDRFKINVIKRDFLGSERITTIPLSGMIAVKVNTGPLSSQMIIKDPEQGEVHVENVPTDAANHFRELVEGIVVGIRQGINFLGMSREEVISSAQNWGAVQA